MQSEQRNEDVPRGCRATRAFWLALVVLTVIRAVFNAAVPLTGEEASCWGWSQHLDVCYFDHPPLIAWLIRLCTAVFGNTVFGVRAASLLCHTATAAIVFHCTRRMTKDGVAAAWAGGFFTTAIFFAVTATVAIPDFVIFLCWALAMWLTIEAVRPGRQKLWPIAGAALGLCGLAKFHAILLALAIGLFLLISPRQRRHFRNGWFYLGVLIAALMILPVLIWNMREGWPTFGFQLAGRHKFVLGSPVYVLEMLGLPFGYVGPVMFPLAAAGTLWGFRQGMRKERDDLLFLALACAVPFLFFLVLSLFIKIDPQWAAPAFVSGVILAALLGVDLARDMVRPRWQRRLLHFSLVPNAILTFLAYGLLLVVVSFPQLIPRDVQLLAHRRKTRASRIGRFYGWKEVGKRLRDEITQLGGPERAFIYSRCGYGTTSSFYFYSGVQAFIFDTPPQGGHQFSIWERKANVKGMNAVVIVRKEKHMDLPHLQAHCERVERAPDLVVIRAGREQQRFLLARAWNLHKRPNAQ